MIECNTIAGAMMLFLRVDPASGVDFQIRFDDGDIRQVAEIVVPFDQARLSWSRTDQFRSDIVFEIDDAERNAVIDVSVDTRLVPGFSLTEFVKTCG